MGRIKNVIALGVLSLMVLGGASELQAASYLGPAKDEQVSAVYFRVGPSYRHYRYNAPGRYYYPRHYYRSYHYDRYYYPTGRGIYFRF